MESKYVLSKRRKDQSSKSLLQSNTGELVLDDVHVAKKRIRQELHIEQGNQHILAALGIKSHTAVIEESLPIVDLFCCIGGYSTGATQAATLNVLKQAVCSQTSHFCELFNPPPHRREVCVL